MEEEKRNLIHLSLPRRLSCQQIFSIKELEVVVHLMMKESQRKALLLQRESKEMAKRTLKKIVVRYVSSAIPIIQILEIIMEWIFIYGESVLCY